MVSFRIFPIFFRRSFSSAAALKPTILPIASSILSIAPVKSDAAAVSSFLHGLCSSDLRTPSSSSPSGSHFSTVFLNSRGRLITDALISRHSDSVSLLIPSRSAESALHSHLSNLDLRRKFSIKSLTNEISSFAILFPPAMRSQSEAESESEFVSALTASVALVGIFPDPRSSSLGLRLLIQNSEIPSLNSFLSSRGISLPVLSDFSVFEQYRVYRGVPSLLTGELESGKSLPVEANFQYFNSISFTKGCYLGQETTARAHFVGQIRKRLFPVFINKFTIGNIEQSIPRKLPKLKQFEDPKSNNLFSASFIDSDAANLPALSAYGELKEIPIFAIPIGSPATSSLQSFPVAGSFYPPDVSFQSLGWNFHRLNVGLAQLRLEFLKFGRFSLAFQLNGELFRVQPYLTEETESIQDEIDNSQELKSTSTIPIVSN